MRRCWWVVVPVLAAALSGCSRETPSRLGGCDALQGAETSSALPAATPAASTATSKDLRCTWKAGASSLDVRVYQPAAYSSREPAADDRLARRWRTDDEQYVTAPVPGVGTSAYRFTAVVDDVVTVTVRAYRGYREVTVELSGPHPRRGGVGGLESAAVAVARRAVTA